MFRVISEDVNGIQLVLFEGTYEECREFAVEERMNVDDPAISIWVEA